MRASLLCLALLPLALASPVARSANISALALHAPSQGKAPEHGASGSHGAVASEVDVCSNVGVDMLALGGSAADAIIAASLCVGVIGAFHSGLSGGGFALVRTAFNKYESYDFRETMPALGNATMYGDTNKSSTVGGLSVGVPGEVRAWQLLHAEHGRLPWAKLFEPAISIARNGFKVPNQLAIAIAQYTSGANAFICTSDIWKDRYCPNGVPLKEGDVCTRPRYAKTLETIARDGPDAFYVGAMAARTAKAVQQRGGILTEKDLADYNVIKRTPGVVKYGNKTVYSTVAPSSGTVALAVLATMGLYSDTSSAGVNLTTHRLIEATRYGYGIRTELADPDFVKNVTAIEKRALSEQGAKERREAISDTATFAAAHYNPENRQVLSDNGTSQLTAVDASGMAVTLTTTINLYWGSRIMTEDGIILNDEMDDFSIPGSTNAFGFAASSANYAAPGKRPLSSICPLIAEESNGQLSFATGSAGGSRIITAVIQNSFAALNGGNLQTAINSARWHDQLGASTVLEWQDTTSPTIPNWQGFSNATAAYLRQLGHNITYANAGSSTAQGVQRFQNGTLLAAHENRQLSSGGSAI